MRSARVFLAVMAGVLGCYAIPFLARPDLLGRLVDWDYRGPNAYAEVRAFYGGLELGLALFFGWAALHPPAVRTALVAFALCFGCAGLARGWGMAEFGLSGPTQPAAAAVEVVTAGLAVWLARRLPPGGAPGGRVEPPPGERCPQ
jgi:hypothetical protein